MRKQNYVKNVLDVWATLKKYKKIRNITLMKETGLGQQAVNRNLTLLIGLGLVYKKPILRHLALNHKGQRFYYYEKILVS